MFILNELLEADHFRVSDNVRPLLM